MSSSHSNVKPKLPITPKSSKMGPSSNMNVLQNKPSYSNTNVNIQTSNSATKRKPRLDIVSSQTIVKRPNISSSPAKNNPPNSVISQSSVHLYENDFNWCDDEDDDDLLLATLDLDVQPLNEGSFKENAVKKPNAAGPSTNHVPPSFTKQVPPSNTRPAAGPSTNHVPPSFTNHIPPSNTRPPVHPNPSNKILSSNLGASTTSNKVLSNLNTRANIINETVSISNTGINKTPVVLAKELVQLRAELTAREGETKNLRLELQKKEKLIFDLKSKHNEDKKVTILQADQKYNQLKKQLEKTNTELKFQTRDIADSEEKMKAMRSLMKLTPGSPPSKLKQPLNSSRALFQDEFQELETKMKESASPRKDERKIETYPRLTADIHVGKILYNMLYPSLFDPPQQGNEIFIEQLESTKSINVSTIKNVLSLTQTVAKPENDQQKNKNLLNKNEASNKPSKIISFSQLPFIPLFTMKSLGEESAHDAIKKIFLKCSKLLEKFLLVLRNAVKYDESYEKRVCKLATSCFTVARSIHDNSLFDPQQWYSDEKGIEVRRAIAVLSALASTSVHAVNLVLLTNFAEYECNLANLFRNSLSIIDDKSSAFHGSNELKGNLSTSKKRKPSMSYSPEERKFRKLGHAEPSTSRMEVDAPRPVSPSSKKSSSSSHETVPSQSSKEERKKNSGPLEKSDILQVILDIVAEVRIQYRTLSFNGVLAAIVSLLKTLAEMDCDIPNDRLNLINNIIKEIVFCCPGPAIIHQVISLMVQLAKYLTCTNSLCTNSRPYVKNPNSHILRNSNDLFSNSNSSQDSFIDSRRHYTFTTDTCVLQVLCTACEMIEKTPEFAENFTTWALKLTLDTSDCPNWLAGDCRMVTCDCFPRFIQLFLNVLHYSVLTYGDEERPVSELSKNQLASVMRRGIIVLNRVILQRNDFLSQVGSWDGLYEAIVHHLLQISKQVNFETPIYDMLNDLSYLEQVEIPESSVQSQLLDEKVHNILSISSETKIEGFSSRQSTPINLQLEKNIPCKKSKKKLVRKS